MYMYRDFVIKNVVVMKLLLQAEARTVFFLVSID